MTDLLATNDLAQYVGTSSHPLPKWLATIRSPQAEALDLIMDAFEEVDYVILGAPTGFGKTIVAEITRRLGGWNAAYICHDKSLQDQFHRDFDYSKVLKGRANYKTELFPDVTCDSCTAKGLHDTCLYCSQGYATCPYQIAKRRAMTAEVAVLNTAYFLSEANYVGGMSGQDFVIADEVDTLENILLGFVTYEIPKWIMHLLTLTEPVKSARKKTVVKWLTAAGNEGSAYLSNSNNKGVLDDKKEKALKGWVDETRRVVKELEWDIKAMENGAAMDSQDGPAETTDMDSGQWLRDYNADVFTLKPVSVSRYGNKYIWRHAEKWLLMSATVISAEELTESLGITQDYRFIDVASDFPVENRPIINAPVANMTYKDMRDGDAVERMIYAIEQIMDKHRGERILVHTVNYNIAKQLYYGLKEKGRKDGRRVLAYFNAGERLDALAQYKRSPGSVLLAASMSRGVDLPGDLCRVQVIAKVPYPPLGDRQVSARKRGPGGDLWYAVQTVRDIVQMTGRGVRSKTDTCTTYILDAQFSTNVLARSKSLLPKWWRDAVDNTQSVRWLRK